MTVGLSEQLITNLPYGSTVTFSWGDIGNPNPNNPAIDIFRLADSTGGTGYLTNETTANEEVADSSVLYVGRVSPGQGIQLPAYMFDSDHYPNPNFIWCGVSNGSGALTLTIADGNSNVLAQATAYIQIMDIKQMYERWTVGDDPSVAPLTTAQLATNDLPEDFSEPFRYVNPPSENTPYILFVHGWNMDSYDKDRFAETAFKRLYWQGYQGRFGLFRWPTGYGFSGWQSIITDPDNFDNSESNAWASGAGLLNKLAELDAQYPGNVYLIAHSMGNVAAGEALRLAGTNQFVNTYIAMHCHPI